MRSKALFGTLILTALAACSTTPVIPVGRLAIEPCVIMPGLTDCHVIPLNKPELPDGYDRDVRAGDICLSGADYSIQQAHIKEILRRCGDRCQ